MKSCAKQNVFLPEESKVPERRYLARWNSTHSKACGRPEEPQVTPEQARCYESLGMSWFLQLLYQELTR